MKLSVSVNAWTCECMHTMPKITMVNTASFKEGYKFASLKSMLRLGVYITSSHEMTDCQVYILSHPSISEVTAIANSGFFSLKLQCTSDMQCVKVVYVV